MRTRLRRAAAMIARATVLLAMVAAGAGAQSVRDDGRIDRESLQLLRAIVDTATAHGLPAQPLLDKILEGSARNVPGPRIVAVVRQYAAALGEARTALGPSSTAPELDAGAAALRSGVLPAQLIRMRAVRGPGTAATSIVILTDLVSRGITTERASDALERVLRLDTDDSMALALRNAVAQGDAQASMKSLGKFLDDLPDSRKVRKPPETS
ncbi:MAG TPA: hypothetical protein VHE78_09690 [Gemmatimonadaceae bacterium]|nr:hypothetical protein [Gemmatimonadaceae bacterium]